METLKTFKGTIALIGAGNMGGAMLRGWVELGLDPKHVMAVDPQPSPDVAALKAKGLRINAPPVEPVDVMLLAIKPQVAGEAINMLHQMVGPDTLMISIMAGKTIKFIDDCLPGEQSIVRAMPNTPAAIGRGISVAVANARVTKQQRALADALLKAAGLVEWVDDEGMIDAVTAVSGSGPAYVFLLAETMAAAGAKAGLPADLAMRLARATVAGSGELMQRSDLETAQLRQNVTSPGGTTAAALDVLMAKDGMAPLLDRAIAAAAKRAKQLAK
ncbi:pyrroline-5-carboxylate reductase [Variibacter gotjawalensis]|nr:pyrroline-5-carboxylate reductase [Variibacter gotjawalensis]NIK49548.1 pyrroline-5-carboxylate reductase [Variibacter gotjawalensis]